MARHRSRHRAVQILYQCDIRQITAEEAIRYYYDSLYSEETPDQPERDDFMEELVTRTMDRRSEIDAAIERHSEHWRMERMPAVDRNIMRLAVCEMMDAKLPAPVIIDEALELVRRFSGRESVAFMNGVLDAIRKQLPGTAEDPPTG